MDSAKAIKGSASGKGMILPFQPMALTFRDVCYYVPYPPVRLFWQRAAQQHLQVTIVLSDWALVQRFDCLQYLQAAELRWKKGQCQDECGDMRAAVATHGGRGGRL